MQATSSSPQSQAWQAPTWRQHGCNGRRGRKKRRAKERKGKGKKGGRVELQTPENKDSFASAATYCMPCPAICLGESPPATPLPTAPRARAPRPVGPGRRTLRGTPQDTPAASTAASLHNTQATAISARLVEKPQATSTARRSLSFPPRSGHIDWESVAQEYAVTTSSSPTGTEEAYSPPRWRSQTPLLQEIPPALRMLFRLATRVHGEK